MDERRRGLGVVAEKDVAVPMRDGTILRANVFRPDTPGRFPAILQRTPYGKAAAGYERYVRCGYVVVTQDSRGRYASEGAFVPFSEESTGDAEDGYDSVEWLARQPYCTGTVGTLGGSYDAWMQWQLARLRPPHLAAMCAYSIPLELTEIDWWGAFRPGRRVKWWMTAIAPDLRRREGLPGPHTMAEAQAIWDDLEGQRWLGLLPWKDLPRYLPEGLAGYVDGWFRSPARRPWRFEEAHRQIEVPNLDFSGWYDHCNGTLAHLALMQREARTERARTQSRLIVGPWNHGGFGRRSLGGVDFGPAAELDIHDVILRWFDRWLRGTDNGMDREPAVRYFVMGSQEWKSAESWPPGVTGDLCLYLSSGGSADRLATAGSLSRQAPGEERCDSYAYDPKDPVPTLWTPALFTVPSDRRRLEHRRDILYYRTEVLEQELEVVGHPRVVLFASSSAPDTDFFARLVDEHPDGRALEICYGMVRARHRASLEREEPLTPGTVAEMRIALGPTACRFLKGHRVRLEITSSDFPNHDRNHNTGRDDLADTELVTAFQKVHHTAVYASRLILPLG